MGWPPAGCWVRALVWVTSEPGRVAGLGFLVAAALVALGIATNLVPLVVIGLILLIAAAGAKWWRNGTKAGSPWCPMSS